MQSAMKWNGVLFECWQTLNAIVHDDCVPIIIEWYKEKSVSVLAKKEKQVSSWTLNWTPQPHSHLHWANRQFVTTTGDCNRQLAYLFANRFSESNWPMHHEEIMISKLNCLLLLCCRIGCSFGKIADATIQWSESYTISVWERTYER